MVSSKVRAKMGFPKTSSSPKQETPPPPSPSPSPSSTQKPPFTRSFGVYFPRASAQVQPRPPDVAELIRLVEELRDRESRLKTELVEMKILKESVNIIPALEKDITEKNAEVAEAKRIVSCLEEENERLKNKCEDSERKVKELESEIAELKILHATSDRRCSSISSVSSSDDSSSSSQTYQGFVEVSVKSSNLIKNFKRAKTTTDVVQDRELKKQQTETGPESELERTRHVDEVVDLNADSRSRGPRVPKPPPKRSATFSGACSLAEAPPLAISNVAPPPPPPLPVMKSAAPAPPPPPPPPRGMKPVQEKVRRVPEVVEFYHSLMRRDSRRDSGAGVAGTDSVPASASTRDMIGEIENRSAHLLAIKTDVKTQGDFIRFLIKEVEEAAFTDIEDVVSFVKWLDDELSYLVDERAVLKHFEWPEQKADALREAAFGYCDLKKIEVEASSFRDDLRQPCGPVLKKMKALFEKLEHGVYNLSRMRESASKRFRVFQIPVNWMQDTGYVSQIKLASVTLARKYMKRVSAELETVDGGHEEEDLIVQGVRFAFRVHQFAGGFDVETMKVFQELRDKARSCHINQQQQKLVCRSPTPY